MKSMDSKSKRLATLIQELRGSQSQRQFAKRLGVSPSSVNFWESHIAWPETENLEKLAALKGWTLSLLQTYLVEGELPSEDPLEQVLKTVRSLPLEALAKVATVAVETLAARSTASTQTSQKPIYETADSKAG